MLAADNSPLARARCSQVGNFRVTFQCDGVDGNPISINCGENGRRGDGDNKYRTDYKVIITKLLKSY